MKKFTKISLAAAAMALGTSALAVSINASDNGKANAASNPQLAPEPTVKTQFNSNGPAESMDPTYNVCRGIDPRCYHPWVATKKNKILLYTRTAGPRHANLGTALAAGLNPPLAANNVLQNKIREWMAEVGVTVDVTEDANVLGGLSINTYDAVVFGSPTRDTMTKHGTFITQGTATGNLSNSSLQTDAPKTALRNFMRSGGGFAGVHNVFGTEYNWPYYEGLLGNANYMDHGSAQAGEVVMVNAVDASTAGLPAKWQFADEWYNYAPFPTKVRFLAASNDNALATGRGGTNPGHSFHPLAWCQYYDGGKAWITSLGHYINAFDAQATGGTTNPAAAAGQPYFKQMVVNGVLSVMGKKPFCQGVDNRPDANGNVRDVQWFSPLPTDGNVAQPEPGSWNDVR